MVNINLSNKPDWYFEKSIFGKVPALELENGDVIYESIVISDYLDEKYTQRPLHPRDPLQKAKDRLLVEQFSKVQTYIATEKKEPTLNYVIFTSFQRANFHI